MARGGRLLDVALLKAEIEKYTQDADLGLIEKAYKFARLAHQGQKRASGEDFIEHPLAVAGILAGLELDVITIAAAVLHDVVEDTPVTLEQVRAEFGDEIALLVDGVTKLSRLEYRSREEEQVENLRKMFLAMARDIRVVLIRLADRLHNLRTLQYLSEEKQREVARETLEVFAPLAHRLGMFRIKSEMEDLALACLEPEKFNEIKRLVSLRRKQRESYIERVIGILREHLARVGVKADIRGRPKHYYSIYKKMYEQGRDFSEIYDLIAVRIIVDTVKDCYGALGVVHTLWKPIPGRFKDFIAMPKSNMYQSLHTSVIGPEGEPFEIQIRTWEMHRTAEYGIAAHWKYKEGRTDPDLDEKLSWLRQILDWQQDLRDAREFMESLRIDLFEDEVFVFTPKGDVIDLPAGSNPVDFAYRIHTDIGHRCVGAKVNGRIVPLDYTLKNGDIVEILTSKQSSGPSADWLKMVKTSSAKNKIRQWFKREKRAENLEKGREALEREIARHGFEPHELMREEWLDEVKRRFNFQTTDDLLVAVGYGGVTAQHVVARLLNEYRKQAQEQEAALEELAKESRWEGYGEPTEGVRIKGVDNVLVRFARCCNPIPGDPIIGYVTRGRGVSVHRLDCPNMAAALKDKQERLIEVAWDRADSLFYPVRVKIDAIDRPGLMSDVLYVIAEGKTNILSARAGADNGAAVIELVLEIRDLEHLERLVDRIKRVRDVVDVRRTARETMR